MRVIQYNSSSSQAVLYELFKRASSVMFIFNRDFRYVYIYMCVAVSYMRMLNNLLLGNEKLPARWYIMWEN